ncbi:MAG TPA: MltA domain-containing protein [Bauldia sp.]|nr:MltA domain-containing protein [Bauldia sp.]
MGPDPVALSALLVRAVNVAPSNARQFFEQEFAPFAVNANGFFTGFYEPEVAGSLTQTAEFRVPLHRPPADFPEARDRAAVMAGALDGLGLELVWLCDPVDAFFIHVQGAARIRLSDGGMMRVTYAAKSGHAYTAIGRVLIDKGALTRETADMAGIRAWLAAHPAEMPAILAANRSYIYFREAPVDDVALGPIAAAKVPLTANRSLAVDKAIHPFHTPVWVETTEPSGGAFRHLLVAQDTGSAIVGPARGDIFFGSGDAAGAIAGAMRAPGRFVVLLPRAR